MTAPIMPLAPGLDPTQVGAKAATLGELAGIGLTVPPGWVIPASACRAYWRDGELPAHVVSALATAMAGQEATSFAVRSSAIQEDGKHSSFAGQFSTTLDVAPADVPSAIVECYRSAATDQVEAYRNLSHLPPDADMGVVIQPMVPATAAAVVFTLDPVTGEDTVSVAEVARGNGADLVGGRNAPRIYRRDWRRQITLDDAAPSNPETMDDAAPSHSYPLTDPVTRQGLENLWDAVWTAQEWAGVPLDMEFAFVGDEVVALQARPVTAIGHAGLEDTWTTANFRDGGVASEVFPPLMWSLYEYIWEKVFPDFLIGSGMLPPSARRRAGRMFYGRPYWNAQMAKQGMQRVPGFVEREFDEDLGITPAYEGQGRVTALTPSSALTVARVAFNHLTQVRRRLRNAGNLAASLRRTCDEQQRQLDQADPEHLPGVFCRITERDYLRSETTYFQQVFINHVHQALFKSTMVKHVGMGDYLALIGGLGADPGEGSRRVSHVKPMLDVWDLTRQIRADRQAHMWWTASSQERILSHLQAGDQRFCLPDLAHLIAHHGHHSRRELDLTTPSFAEDPSALIGQVLAVLELDDSASPHLAAGRARADAEAALERLRDGIGPVRMRWLRWRLRTMRTLLWWREEFRDLSTRQYHLIRQATVRLARLWADQGLIESPEDLWFADIGHIWTMARGQQTPEQFSEHIAANRRYFTAYRNYRGPEELGPGAGWSGQGASPAEPATKTARPASTQPESPTEKTSPAASQPPTAGSATEWRGVGCQPSLARGRARVIASLDELHRISPGDVVVTQFTDTGWTSALGRIGALVTEFGGMLCHAAIISRECSIPCVVAVPGALAAIPDGAMVEVDGARGVIRLVEAA
ncbi:MAG: hypothetical protein LBH48_06690 [Bifidobacteriaceae bacterium]|jgi:pyruvate,water dikinase|nr:hypothetical protein [Bifidobacteriaceae bacterium]